MILEPYQGISTTGKTHAPSFWKSLGTRNALLWSVPKEESCNCASGRKGGPKQITTDRPTFTPSSRTVGRGRFQVESGYTFSYDDNRDTITRGHSFPETDIRVGLFEWLEFRIRQNYNNVDFRTAGQSMNVNGALGLVVGTRVWLTENDKWIPESAATFQVRLPTGDDDITTDEVLAQGFLSYSWAPLPDKLYVGGSSQFLEQQDGLNESYVEIGQTGFVSYVFTDKLTVFGEGYGQWQTGSRTIRASRYLLDTGVLYHVTNNVQLDFRVGLGLNDASTDFFTGAGLAFRF